MKSSYQAPDNWPDKGEIEFQQLGIRYREDLDLALKEIDCKIYPNEKVNRWQYVAASKGLNRHVCFLFTVCAA